MLDTNPERLSALAGDWLDGLDRAVQAADDSALADLFHAQSYWRDAVAITWRLGTVEGGGSVRRALSRRAPAAGAGRFALDPRRPAPASVMRAGEEVIEAFFTFDTDTGRCEGIVRLSPDAEGRVRARTLFTALDEIKGHEERTGRNRPRGQSFARDFSGPNWLDQRREAAAYRDRDPDVIVVGAGQAGLAIAARLGRLGLDALVLDRHARIGDNWRKRYHALTLHNQVQVNHMPYMPFPPSWPTYIPKDMLANWFESYAEAMELNVWTGTELRGGSYDDATGRWTVTLGMADGGERVMRPRHVVMATGVSGIPQKPEIPTLENFSGPVLHSSEYGDGQDWTGRSAIVIGTGNSGHDIAQDLYSSGAAVTIVQRSPTLIVNIEPSAQLPYALYDEGPSLEECDLIVTATPFELVRRTHVDLTEKARQLDRPLLEKLEERGFRLDFGEDGSGWQFKYLTRGGGYYFNVGCSDLIAEGKIGFARFEDIATFEADGARLRDGGRIPADVVILATGYKGQEHLVERLFGPEVAARVGPIWGFGDGNELRNMFTATGQPGLWFIAGSLAQCRIFSKYMALEIKARELGLVEREAAAA